MTLSCYRGWDTDLLLTLKEKLEYEKSNWERKIAEQRAHYNKFMQTIGEYKSRVKYCKKHLRLINKVLKERNEGPS